MSRLYKKYVVLKVKNSQKMYLFEAGIFYLFIDEDAKIMAKELNLKLSNLNANVVKCGFPVKSLDKYIQILKEKNFNVEIVPSSPDATSFDLDTYVSDNKLMRIIENFLEINVDDLSIGQAFEVLHKLHNDLQKFVEEKRKYEHE